MEPTLEDFQRLLHYDEKTGIFRWRECRENHILAGNIAGCLRRNRRGLVEIKFMGRIYRAHRVAWLMTYGSWPDGIIDHKNRNPSDNRIENLRLVTKQQSNFNRGIPKNNQLGVKGVSRVERSSGRVVFHAYIRKDDKLLHLGFFTTMGEAEQARIKAERKLFCEFGRMEIANDPIRGELA